jgi:hypothetical protein
MGKLNISRVFQYMTNYNYEILMDPEEEKAAVLKPDEFKRLKRAAASGRNGPRNPAIVWFSFGSVWKVTEIATLLVKDVQNADGSLKDQFRLPAAYTKNGESRLAYIVEQEHKEAIVKYLEWRLQHKKG